MGKKDKDALKHQLKTLENIGDKIKTLIEKHRDLKRGQLGVMFRTVIEPNGTTIYKKGSHGKGVIHSGVRECDYKFSNSNPDWVEACNDQGLSFSLTLDHAIDAMKFLAGFQKKGTGIRCAYWILEDNPSIPEGMAFVEDPDNPAHYLLIVTRRMRLTELVDKLKWIGMRMAVMNDLPLEAFRHA